MSNVVFISEMKDMKVDASSTQIMTYNLLYGLKEAGFQVVFLAVCNYECNVDSVIEDYLPIVEDIHCVPSAMNLLSKKRGLLSKYAIQYKYAIDNAWYKEQVEKLGLSDRFDILLTHLPAIESSYYAIAVKRMMPRIKYIQYWSDPYARSGLTAAGKLPVKRYIMKFLENRILNQADEIVYGTQLLMETQAKEYPKLSKKMRFCDVSYNVYSKETDSSPLFDGERPLAGYIGGYRSTYRNIDPLYQTFLDHPELGNLVLCGFSDIHREEKENIKIIARCSPQRALGIEEQLDIHVCLLNKTMSQIPGKIFYQTNSGKPILVILDGPDKSLIRGYLEKFDRFEFAENNESDIYNAISGIIQGKGKAAIESPGQLSPIRFACSVAGEMEGSFN